MTSIVTIDLANERGWHQLWLESYFILLIGAFMNVDLVPWQIIFYRKKKCIMSASTFLNNIYKKFFMCQS